MRKVPFGVLPLSIIRYLFFLLICSLPMFGQQSAAITYTQDFPGSDPSHFAIALSSDGHARYEGNGRLISGSGYLGDGSVQDTEQLEFVMSPGLTTKIFELAKRAHYFQKPVDSKRRNLAFTGKKTITYSDALRHSSETYNYPVIAEVAELTRIFQDVSATLEFGRRLGYSHRHQKLALDEVSKQMEAAAKSDGLENVSAIASIMQGIIDDQSVINVVRARLLRILSSSDAHRTEGSGNK